MSSNQISVRRGIGTLVELDPGLVPCTECGIGLMLIDVRRARFTMACMDCGFVYHGHPKLRGHEIAAAYAEWAIGRRQVLRREREKAAAS